MEPGTSHFDVIVVGSGAGGSAAAHRLAQAGRRVLLLERGQDLPEDGSTLDPGQVLAEGAFKSHETWIDRRGAAFAPEESFNLGGKTRWYGAALLRFSDDEFFPNPVRAFLPWPIKPADIAPYYDEAERLLDVRTFALEPGLRQILQRLEHDGSGWRMRPLQLGLSRDIVHHPEYATRFDGFALPGGHKADAKWRFLAPLSNRANLTILTGAQVGALLHEDDRRVAGVQTTDGRRFTARAVVLAAGALHSPRLLQEFLESTGRSANKPVGGYYKRHVLTAVLGFSWRVQHDLLRKTALLVNPRLPHSSVQPLGGWIDREIVRSLFPRWVPAFIREFFARRVYGFFLQTEDGSHDANRVRAANGAGAPVLDYDLRRLPGAEREHRRLVRGFMWSLLRAGFLPASKRIPLAGSAHSVGTLAAGSDPNRSAVNADGRVHGFDNLYVADGSVLPRIGRFNPALTIYAWGLRLGDHLLRTIA